MKLATDFYQRDVITVAQELLGKYLIRQTDSGQQLICRIVETEAYKGPEDKGSHAYGNKRTKRTATMFKPGGCTYVYLIYGIHHMLNIVTAGQGQPQAVLIRALEPIAGINNPTNGPGKLCSALEIDRSLDGYDLINGTKLYLETPPEQENMEIVKSKRINIDYAEEYRDKLWRFYISGNPYVSR